VAKQSETQLEDLSDGKEVVENYRNEEEVQSQGSLALAKALAVIENHRKPP